MFGLQTPSREMEAMTHGGLLPGPPTCGGISVAAPFQAPPTTSLSLAPTSHLFNVLIECLGRNCSGWLCFSETVSFVIDEGSEGVKPWGTGRQIVGCFFPSLGHI